MTSLWTIGIDVGGTFTDFVALQPASGRVVATKEPTVSDDPASVVRAGVAGLLRAAGITAAQVASVRHGTTLGLNTLLERTGARAALVVSRGFRDMLELGRGDLPNPYSYKAPKPVPAIPRERVIEIAARLQPDGRLRDASPPGELDGVAARLASLGVETVVVSLVNGYAAPEVEAAIARALHERLPDVHVTAAAALWPEVREYERTLAAVLNALILPRLDRYYGAVERDLAGLGLSAPLLITTSAGGCMSAAAARERPVETLLSGPAAGAFAAARGAAEAGLAQAVALDMGGTSSDISIVEAGRLAIATETRLGEFPLMLPAADIWAIGAGGGSIVAVDEAGVLKVGPRSAGATPGPVCYARGGTQATVTDCTLVAGFLDPAYFLGGRLALDRDAATRALAAIAARLGLAGPDDAAEAALRVVTARMASALGNGLARRGLDPRRIALMAYGGAGPVLAVRLAEAVGLSEVLVPANPGTFCALGAATAALRGDFVRARRIRIGVDADAGAALAAAVAGMEREARDWFATQGANGAAATIAVTADLQYPRTAAVLTVPVPEPMWRAGDAAAVAALFHDAHEIAYGFRDARSAVDAAALRLSVTGGAVETAPRLRAASLVAVGTRMVFWRGARIEAAVWRRAGGEGTTAIVGPALIEQDDTTLWVAPSWDARLDAQANLRLEARR